MAAEKKDLGYVRGDQGPRGFTFTPKLVLDEDQISVELSWENDGELENPEPVKLVGPVGSQGPYYTPSVASDGTITWSGSEEGMPEVPASKIAGASYAVEAETAHKLGDKSVGSTKVPIYLNNGEPSEVNKIGLAEVSDKAIQLKSIDTQNRDLDTIQGSTYWGGIGLALAGNTCANKPNGVDSFAVQVYANSESGTSQLLVSGSNVFIRDYTDSWSNWNQIYPSLSTEVANKLGSATIGGENSPIYLKDGEPVAIEKISSATSAEVASKIGNDTVGGGDTPVYIDAGVPKAISKVASAASADKATEATNATNAGTANKLGATTVGGVRKPIYLLEGVPTEAEEYPTIPGVATGNTNGLMSSSDKTKLDTITGGEATSVVLANGTVTDFATLLRNNIATIRSALGVVTQEAEGLVPKLPADPNA